MKITTASDMPKVQVGDIVTIAGLNKPDKRWLPRIKAWLLRKPAPLSNEMIRFVVREVK